MAFVNNNTKKGSLTIAGSGIASVRHITLETLFYIENSDEVYYAVTDPTTEAFILDKAKCNCVDLTIYYDKDKNRYESYVQMCEVMLHGVRAGRNVLGIFYGHPGVFVSPSHRAIAIASGEGYHTTMLPGVSAEDYMFANLGFDPVMGCMTQEATNVALNKKRLDPSIHNIIWQVGAVGVANMVFDNSRFHLFVDRLEADLGVEHKVIHYIGAILPQDPGLMLELTVADLRREDVVRQITPISTFYMPPRESVEDVAQKLKLQGEDLPLSLLLSAPLRTSRKQQYHVDAYGKFERAAVDRLTKHVVPSDHEMLRGSPALRRFMVDLALRPDLLASYQVDPSAVLDGVAGLTKMEKFALSLNKPAAVYELMRATESAIHSGRESTLDEISKAPTRGKGPTALPLIYLPPALCV